MKRILNIVSELFLRYRKHHITAYSAQMAYFFMFSIFPLLIFFLMVVSRFDLQFAMQQTDLLSNLPEDINELFTNFIKQIDVDQGSAVLSVAGLGTLYSASRGVTALQRAMNVVYEIDETRHIVKVKLVGMLYTFLFILLMVATLLIPNIGYKILSWLQNNLFIYFDINIISIFKWGRGIFLGALYVLIFGTIYSKLPNERLQFKDCYYGAVFAFLATLIENFVFSKVVIELTDYTLLYGSLSVVMVFMLWLYIFGNIIMFGAEINSLIWEYRHHMTPEEMRQKSD